MHVFLGITGASGAPYAARLLEALAAADCEIGVSASSAAVEVIATELYGNPRLSRDETLTRLLEHAPDATLYDVNDWKAPYASGSAKVDAYVICPCSMGTLGTIASGSMSNLIHRAASVALKEEVQEKTTRRVSECLEERHDLLPLGRRAPHDVADIAAG